MAARFSTLPRSSTVKRRGCALQSATEELNYQAAWLRALVRFRGAQLPIGTGARFGTPSRSSAVKRHGCAL
eukprot:8431290-Heterocapsa_arctica.AAC.1